MKSSPIRVLSPQSLPTNLEYCWLYDHDTRREYLCVCGTTRGGIGELIGEQYQELPEIPYAASLNRTGGWYALDGSANVSIIPVEQPSW